MPTYNLTSPATGNTYPVEFQGSPTEQDFQDAIDHFDAPTISQKNIVQNSNMTKMLGGELLNPETEQPVYSPDQSSQDQSIVSQDQNSKRISSLQNEISNQENLSKSSPLESALAGIGSVPVGIGNLGAALAKNILGKKTYQQAFPNSDIVQSEVNKQIEGVGGANPLSAGIGSAIANAPMIASGRVLPGGALINTGNALKALTGGETDLAKQLALKAAGEAVPSAAINAAAGQGIRSLTGQETKPSNVLNDALLGAVLGGQNPEAEAQVKQSIQDIPQTIKSAVESIPTPFSTTQFKAATQALRPANKIGTTWNEEFVGKGLGAVKDLGGVDVEKAPEGQAVGTFIQGAGNTLNKLNNAIKAITDNPNAAEVEGRPIIHKILQSVANDKTLAERPEEVQSILDDFKIYDRNIPLDEAERLLEQTNAELFGPVYNRTVEGKKIASADLQIKAQQALAEGLRDQINTALDDALGETGAGADLKKTYGAVATMKREAQKRYLVALRQAQNSLPEQLSYANSAADIVEGLLAAKTGGISKILSGTARSAVAKSIKDLNTSDSMIRSAFKKTPEGASSMSGQEFPQSLPRPEVTPEDVAYALKLRKERLSQ